MSISSLCKHTPVAHCSAVSWGVHTTTKPVCLPQAAPAAPAAPASLAAGQDRLVASLVTRADTHAAADVTHHVQPVHRVVDGGDAVQDCPAALAYEAHMHACQGLRQCRASIPAGADAHGVHRAPARFAGASLEG